MKPYELMILSFLVCATFWEAMCDKELQIKMLNDYLMYDKQKCIKINAFLCWTKEEKHIFINSLFAQNFQTSILSTHVTDIPNEYADFNILFILDLDCKNSTNILQRANYQKLYKFSYKWLMVSDDPNILDRVNSDFISYDIYPDSEVILARKFNDLQYSLLDIYRYAPHRQQLIQNNVLNWTESQKFGKFKRRNVVSNRLDLNGTLVKASVVILNNDTINHLTDYRDKHIDSVTKLNFAITNHLISFANASTQYYFVGTWGYREKKSNSYTGMIGLMEKNEVEIGGTALFFTKERVPIIDYVGLTTRSACRFVFRSPPLSYQSNIFTLPFSTTLWISSLCLILLFIFLLYFAVYLEWHQHNLPESSNALHNSFLDIVMFTMSAVAQQGDTCEPRSGAGKIIMIFAFISLMFLYVSYSANIVALLQSSTDNIKTLEDLLESRLKCGVDSVLFHRYYFETATEPIRKAIYQKKVAPPGQKENYMNVYEGVKRIREGFFAFHMEIGPGYKIIEDTFYEYEKCGLKEIKYLTIDNAFLSIRKNSSYKKIIKLGLRKIYESGLQSAETLRLYTKKPECQTSGANFVSVGIIDSYPAFLFLIGGIALALLLFLLEVIAAKNGFRACRT